MKRWLVNILTALSLLLCLATAVMWVRSYWVHEGITWNSALEEVPATTYSLNAESGNGGLVLGIARVVLPSPDDIDGDSRPAYLKQIKSERESAGWRYGSRVPSPGSRHGFDMRHGGPYGFGGAASEWWSLVLPYWFLLALTAVLPGFVGWRRRRAAVRRRRVGTCAVCGYDLRASPQRCPECGQPVA